MPVVLRPRVTSRSSIIRWSQYEDCVKYPIPNFHGLIKVEAFNKTLRAEVEDTEEVLQCSYLKDHEVQESCETCNEWCREKLIDGGAFCASFHTFTGPDFYCKHYTRKENE